MKVTYFFTTSQSRKRGNDWFSRTVNVWKVEDNGIKFLATKTEGSITFDQLARELIAEVEPHWTPAGGSERDAKDAVHKAKEDGLIDIIQLD
ncbi:hypothetical protein [Spirosoma sp.]|uniref:hypothetical protein n=1 Tax=Spirosoma sp. TaxID=1899569 RepID=UPI0026166445|nr:hypothetical protein [Spirosoma sp.]MCX6217574.1 hypothetical protein [Spirosoma sp.]